MKGKKIVIVGGGLSGVLTAMRLAEMRPAPEVVLLEKDSEKLGRGVAYQHDFTHQPLNVPAAGMSLYPDKPLDFLTWLQENSFRYSHLIKDISAQSFVPRKIFGDYVVERLQALHDRPDSLLEIRIDEAIHISGNETKTLRLISGAELTADAVILALGNFPPVDILPENKMLKADSRYFSNPWTDRVYRNINGGENILLLGTGLTAVDVVLGLAVRNFSGRITMLSRRGRLPMPHTITSAKMDWPGEYLLTPNELFHKVRKLIRENAELPWTAVLDALRPHVQKIWMSWSDADKKYFMRRLRPFWEIARHRIPEFTSSILHDMVKDGRLELCKGEIAAVEVRTEGLRASYREQDKMVEKEFQKIINCTGPQSNYRELQFPVIKDLLAAGSVVPDKLGLGIMCAPNGNIINSSGTPEAGLWCIGPMRKSVLWETTALREIRDQADELAKLLV